MSAASSTSARRSPKDWVLLIGIWIFLLGLFSGAVLIWPGKDRVHATMQAGVPEVDYPSSTARDEREDAGREYKKAHAEILKARNIGVLSEQEAEARLLEIKARYNKRKLNADCPFCGKTTMEIVRPAAPAPTAPPPPPVVPKTEPSADEIKAANLNRAPNREFEKIDAVKNGYQLDARKVAFQQILDVIARPGMLEITTDPDYKVCSSQASPCAGPEGIFKLVEGDPNGRLYATTQAKYYELIGRWGDDGEPFRIGSYYCEPVPKNVYGKKLQVMANVPAHKASLDNNTGGHRILSAEIK